MPDAPGKMIITAAPIRETGLSAQASAHRTADSVLTAAGREATFGSTAVLGLQGVPAGAALPSVLATGSPLSVFQYTLSRADRLALYRYFAENDPFVARAMELHTELPMSRITVSAPKGPSSRQNKETNRIYENVTERLGLLQLLLDIAREYWMIGSVYIWHEWNPEILEWDQLYILPVEYCVQGQSAILMENGVQRRIDSVKVGDRVLSAEGHVRTVIRIYEREVDEVIYRVKARGMTAPIEITGNHEIYTTNRGKVRVDNLTLEDKLGYKPPQIETPQIDITDDHCYLAGWWLAEGCNTDRKSVGATDRAGFFLDPNKPSDIDAAQKLLVALERAFPPERRNAKYLKNWEEREPYHRMPPRRMKPLPEGAPDICPHCGAPEEWLGSGGKTPKGEPKIKCYHCNRCSRISAHEDILRPYVCHSTYGKSVEVGYTNQKAYDFLNQELGQYSRGKKLTARWLFLPKHQQKILLQTWLLGDAGIPGNDSATGVTTSRDLRDQMYLIAARLGIHARPFTCYQGKVIDEREIRDKNQDNLRKFYYGLYIMVGEAQKLWDTTASERRQIQKGKRVARVIRPTPSNTQTWTTEKDQLLKDKYEELGRIPLAVELGTTPSAVGSRAYRLGLQTKVTAGPPKTYPVLEDGTLALDIEAIEKISYKGPVYNIEVEDDHSYHVEGAQVANCHSVLHPFMRDKELVVFSRPLVDTASIRRMTDRDLYMLAGDPDMEELIEEVEDDLPTDLKEILDYGEGTPLNADPEKGSYVFPLHRQRPPNETYGRGLVQRCLEALLRLENLKNAQLQISGRNMQPKHLVYGEALSQAELDDLRAQVDLAILDNVDFPIVTNYPVHWETINANERLLNVETEYSSLREELAVGLGTTTELLTGQATYGGQRITLEMMNTQYLMFREIMRDYVERGVFRPIAEAKGHYYFEEIDTWVKTTSKELEPGDDVIQEYDGTLRKRQIQVNKTYNHSKLRFNRLSIRDNQEVYDQLFQLHQKGSLALHFLLDIHNIDPDENAASLLEDLATVRDPTFNRLVEGLYTAASDEVLMSTDFVARVIEGLNLDMKSQVAGEPAPGADLGGVGGLGVGSEAAPTDYDTGLTEGQLGPELGPDLGLEAPVLSGQPATVPPVVSSRRREKKEDDELAQLSGQKLSESQVRALVAAQDTAPEGKRLTGKMMLKVTASSENGVPKKSRRRKRRR